MQFYLNIKVLGCYLFLSLQLLLLLMYAYVDTAYSVCKYMCICVLTHSEQLNITNCVSRHVEYNKIWLFLYNILAFNSQNNVFRSSQSLRMNTLKIFVIYIYIYIYIYNASLLNAQHYKVRIKGKVKQSREGVAPSPTPWCSSYRKGSLRVTLDYGRQLYLLIYMRSAEGNGYRR